jgi:hypothetical protein
LAQLAVGVGACAQEGGGVRGARGGAARRAARRAPQHHTEPGWSAASAEIAQVW